MRVQKAATTIRPLRLPQIRTNHSHGLRRTNADKQHAVEVALKAFPDRNDRSIADLCGVSHPSVSAARRQLVKYQLRAETPRFGRQAAEASGPCEHQTGPAAVPSGAIQRP
jgi:hypothetical protein